MTERNEDMIITKKEIIETIKKEHLTNEQFIYVQDSDKASECRVCAVGAILRKKLNNISDSNTLAIEISDLMNNGVCSHDGDLEVELYKKRYLNALSVKFEKLSMKYKTQKTIKKHLIDFIELNFPSKFKV